MRSIVILFVGCVPLAVLTAWSFVELGSVDGRPAPQNVIAGVPAQTELAEKVRAQLEREKPLSDELAETDLLAGEAIPTLDALPADSSFKPVADAWPQWTGAHQLVTEYLRVARLAETAELEDLKDVGLRLQALKEKCRTSPPKGSEPFVTLLDRRIADLKQQVVQRERQLEAATLLDRARAAFKDEQYGQCVAFCNDLLSSYAAVMDASTAEKVGILRERARFWADAGRLVLLLGEADTPARRIAVLESFLNKYSDPASRTATEQRVLEKCRRQLDELKDQLAAEEQDRAAARLIDELGESLPARFDDRLENTVRIVRKYPTDAVKLQLRTSVEQWLREFVPEKQIRELPLLEEAETSRREIIRGFFKEVKAPDGTPVGYKRYPTYAQYLNPVAEVGTYRKAELIAGPAPSVPRRCVTRYGELRERLLEKPDRREMWVEFAALCETLQAELNEYRKKPGSSSEPLSFEEEGRFARELLAGPGWADMETLLEP